MQVILNIPDEIPQEMISKMLMQFENQLQTAKQLVTKKEKPIPKFGSAKGLIKMSADFDEPLDDFADFICDEVHYRSNAPRWNASEDAPASSFQSVFY